MKVFTKLRHYGVPSNSPYRDRTDDLNEISVPSGKSTDYCQSLGLPDTSTGQKTLMWVNTAPTQPQSSCTACWRHFYLRAQPTLRTIGQCMFGVAILSIMAGIALCIWGFVGEEIKPFQIFGPVCIGAGLFIYIIGCILCCREYPAFEKTLQVRARQEKARRAVEVLADKEVAEWIQNEPEVFEDFKEVASQILHQQAYNRGNVIENTYADSSDLELDPT